MHQIQSDSVNELFAALSKAQGEIKHAIKEANNPFYKSKYAPLPAVIDAAKVALAKHGLSVSQPTSINEQGQSILITQLSHESGQWIRAIYPLKPVKDDPQGLAAAVTYARRVCFGSVVGIASDIDDDGMVASGIIEEPVKKKPVFTTAAARKVFVENARRSFEDARSLKELQDIRDLNASKFKEMREATENDVLAVEELVKDYTICERRFKEEGIVAASFGQGFSGTRGDE